MKISKKILLYHLIFLLSQNVMAKKYSDFFPLKINIENLESDTIIPPTKEEPIFEVIENMPLFPGCEDKGISDKQELKKCAEAVSYTHLTLPTKRIV